MLVNATDFFLRDAHDVIGALKRTKQGTFTLDNKRSAFHLARTKSFLRNTEVEVTLTFGGSEPGQLVKDVTPDPKSITVRERRRCCCAYGGRRNGPAPRRLHASLAKGWGGANSAGP